MLTWLTFIKYYRFPFFHSFSKKAEDNTGFWHFNPLNLHFALISESHVICCRVHAGTHNHIGPGVIITTIEKNTISTPLHLLCREWLVRPSLAFHSFAQRASAGATAKEIAPCSVLSREQRRSLPSAPKNFLAQS